MEFSLRCSVFIRALAILGVLALVPCSSAQYTWGDGLVGQGTATPATSSAVVYSDIISGSDVFAQVQNAVNLLGANGGQVFATGFTSGSYILTSGLERWDA